MSLNNAQLLVLKADILANTDPAVVQAVADGSMGTIANWYNQEAVPDYWVYRNNVSLNAIGNAIDGQNLADITTTNSTRLANFFITNPGGGLPSRQDHRAFFDDVFSGAAGSETRASLALLWVRKATYLVKLFATSGDGSPGDPATPTVEESLNYLDVVTALSL